MKYKIKNELLTDNCLKPKKEKIQPYNIFGFDIETYGKYNKFLMGSIVNGSNNYVFWDKDDMINFILTSHIFRGKALIFATNLGFDFLSLFGDKLGDYNFEFLIRGSSFLNIKLTLKSGHVINFRDTMNFFKGSVAYIGKKILGLEKLPKPKCLGKKPKNKIERKELEVYNIRDSYITYKFSEFLQKSFNDLGTNMKYTIASTSMSLFQNKYLDSHMFQPKKEIIDFMFKAYYGGRTECINRGKITNRNYYDINSLYPYVMCKKKYPHPNYINHIKFKWSELNYRGNDIEKILLSKNSKNNGLDLIKNYEGISYCLINCKFDLKILESKGLEGLENYPIIPFRDEFRGKLTFPLGYIETYQTHLELRKAISLGYDVTVIESYYYTKTFNPFENFVNDLYNKRLEEKAKKSPLQMVYKILLNSLYGKFAQKMEHTEVIINNSEENKERILKAIRINYDREKHNQNERYKIDLIDECKLTHDTGEIISPQIYYLTDKEKKYIPKFINPILSIYITSYARLELYNLIEESIYNGFLPDYFDTDSIITQHTFNESKELGALKKEYEIKEGVLVKPKMYFFKGIDEDSKDCEIYKCKGLMNIKSYEDFVNILDTKEYHYTKFTKFKESLRRKIYFNEMIDVTKKLDLEDNKRKWKKEFNQYEKQESKPIEV